MEPAIPLHEKENLKFLFNKGGRAKNEDDVGHVMKEANVVFDQSKYRFDIPKSHIIAVGRNIILDMDLMRYLNIKLTEMHFPTGEPVEKLIEEAYPEDYHRPKEEDNSTPCKKR